MQQGSGMPVFMGSAWQRGHCQVGYGLAGLFKRLATVAIPLVKSGAKSLGKVALNTGEKIFWNILSGKNVKEAEKFRINETTKDVKKKAVDKLRAVSQTGSGKPTGRQVVKKTAKKRKTSPPGVRSVQPGKQKTTRAQDTIG